MAPRDSERLDASPSDRDNRAGSGHSPPTDVGRTSGGGSLGHDQPPDVEEQTHTRNAARTPTRPKSEPVMPEDDSTLETKI